MTNNFVSLEFLSYKPDSYEFSYVSCQLSETLLLSVIMPVVAHDQISFLFDAKILDVLQ